MIGMDGVTLLFLGTPVLRRGDRTVRLVRAKAIGLLLYLAATRVVQPRERVLDLLWPESSAQAGRKNMRNTLWEIREALGDDVLEQDATTLRLSDSVVIDLHTLENGLLLLQSASVENLEATAAAYRGLLADGLVVHHAPEFEIWLVAERERVTALYLRLLERIVALHRAEGAWQSMRDAARRALSIDPLRESLHLAAIEADLRLGDRAGAAQQYATLIDTLRRELDVAPLPETTRRYEALLAGSLEPVARPRPVRAVAPHRAPDPFVGRRAELAALRQEQLIAQGGAARVVLLAGDLGIGKTRLWQTWAASLPPDATLLTTHALYTTQPVPFGPLMTLFRQPGPLRSIVEPPSSLAPIWLAELSRLLPEIAAMWPALPVSPAQSAAEERARLFQALVEAMRRAADGLLVLVVDDLHWADSATLDWLVFLIDQRAATSLLVIATYRPQEASPALEAVIAGWQRQSRARRLELEGLSDDDALALAEALGGQASGDLRSHWVHQSGGNPYFLTELTRAAADQPPNDLASLVLTRLRSMVSADAFQVLQAAAVLGDGADAVGLRLTGGRSEEETIDALDALVAARVLSESHGAYSFVHPLIASVVQGDLSVARRRFLHRRAAQAIERTNAGHCAQTVGALIMHYAAAGEPEIAARYADLATIKAREVGALAESASYARQALTWAPTPDRRLRLAETLVIVEAGDEAQSLLLDALADFERDGDAVRATRVCLALAQVAIVRSQPEIARAWLDRAPLAQAEVIDPPLGVHARLWAASVDRLSQSFDQAQRQLDQIDALLARRFLPLAAAQSAFERGNLQANRGDPAGAIVWFEQARRIALEIGDGLQQAMAENNLAYHCMLVGRLDEAQQYIESARQLADRFALLLMRQYIHSTAGEIALAIGRLDEADDEFERALAAARAFDNRVQIANVQVNRAQVARDRGDFDRARALVKDAEQAFGAAIDAFVAQRIRRLRAELGAIDLPERSFGAPTT